MADKPKQVVYTPVDIDDAEFVDFSREKSDDEIDFETFRDEMRESNEYAKITVYRQPMTSDNRPGAKKLVFLFECGMDEFSFSQICGKLRDEYGSGTYRIQARDVDKKLRMNRAIQIEAPRIDGVEPNPTGDIIDRVTNAMAQQMDRTEQMLRGAIGPQHGGDAFDQMTKMMTAMGTMMAGFGITPQQSSPPKTLTEQLQEFVLIKELIGSGGDGDSGDANIFSLLTETVKNFGPLIGAAIAQGQREGVVSDTGIIRPQPAQLVESEKPVEDKTVTLDDAEKERLKAMEPQLKFLCSQAKGGAEANDVAVFVMKMIPDEQMEAMEEFLLHEHCLELCIQVLPELSTVKDWFSQWRLEMLKLLGEALDADEVEELKTELGDEVEELKTELGDELASDIPISADKFIDKKVPDKQSRSQKKTKKKSKKKVAKAAKPDASKDLTSKSDGAHDPSTVAGDDGNGKHGIAPKPKREASSGT